MPTARVQAANRPDLDRAHPINRAQLLAADFATRAADHDRDGSFPFENFDALHQAGLLTLTIPTEFAGQGSGLDTVCRVIEGLREAMPQPRWC